MVLLHEDKFIFMQTLMKVAGQLNLPVPVVEKDYWVFMLLKYIRRNNPDVLFKGGTSLSKAYGIINRFSEDIDLNALPSNPLTEAKRRDFNVGIMNAYEALGLKLRNELVRTRSDFVCFIAQFPQIQGGVDFLTDVLKVKSVLRRKGRVVTCRYVVKPISNYIYDCLSQNASDISKLKAYELDPFEICVQDVRYTLCEKLISIGNNYLRGKSDRLSRHLYDVYKIIQVVPLDADLRMIFNEVYTYTQGRGFDDAIIEGRNLEDSVYKAMQSDFYKDDFAMVSSKFIWEKVVYESCKKVLLGMVYSGLMNTVSDVPYLRDLEVSKINGKLVLCDNKMNRMVVTKDYLYRVKDRLRNKKFTSDGKLVDRFG